MNFYYKGELMKQSDRHAFTHALLDERGELVTCSTRRELAEKKLRMLIFEKVQEINRMEKRIECARAGKTYVYERRGRHGYRENISLAKIGIYEKRIEAAKKAIEILEKYKIVELEAKEE